MCCICTVVTTVISHLLYFSEKFLLCFSCAALVSCLVATLLVTLGMGIGIGYNYCYVDYKTKHRYVPAKYYKYNPTPHWKRSAPTDVTVSGVTINENILRSNGSNQTLAKNMNMKHEHETKSNKTNNNEEGGRGTEESYYNISHGTTEQMSDKLTEANTETTDDSPKMIIPISGLDLIALLSKLRSENRNYSLQIVTT